MTLNEAYETKLLMYSSEVIIKYIHLMLIDILLFELLCFAMDYYMFSIA